MTMFCGVSGLSTHGVDDRVADEGGEGQPHRQRIDREPEQRAAGGARAAAENSSVCAVVSSPLAVGRQAVRAMRASIRCSTRQLNAAAARGHQPDADRRRQRPARQSGRPGVASSMPISGAEDDQLHDARLGQRVVLAQRDGSETLRGGGRREGFGHDRRVRFYEASAGAQPASTGEPRRRAPARCARAARSARRPAPPRRPVCATAATSGQPSTHVAEAAGESARRPAPASASAQRPRRRLAAARAGARRAAASAGSSDERAEAMRHVDRGQRGERQEAAVAVAPSGRSSVKPSAEVHRRPPAALAGREVAAGEHRVVGADPAAERDLQRRQHGDRRRAPRRKRRRQRERRGA